MGRILQSSALMGWLMASVIACSEIVIVSQVSSFSTDDSDSADECAMNGDWHLVCLDFEDDLPPTRREYNGLVSIDRNTVFRGNGAMKCETTQLNGFASVRRSFSAIESGTVFFRMHILIPPSIVTGNTKILNLSALTEPVLDEDRGVDVNIGADRNINIYQHRNELRFTSAQQVVPEGRWFCLWGSYAISKTLGATSVWIDDDLVVSTEGNTEAIINGGVSELEIGIGWTETGQNYALFYFDNVVLSESPVPCID